jgi:uncharacterized membrane protein YkvA (DUF1232 family)
MTPLTSRPTLWGAFFGRARLAWSLVREPQVPLLRKAIPLLALAYVISPLDLIPDVLPFVGELDDLMLLVLGLELFVRVCPQAPVVFHRAAIAAGQRFAPMRPDSSRPDSDGGVIDAEFRRE